MVPAHECFHADKLKPTNVNLRLVLHEKLRALETRPYIAFEHELFQSPHGSTRRVEMKIVAALHLRSIERNASRLQQSRRITTVLRVHADTNTARHEDFLIVEDERLIECLLDGARDIRRILCAWNVREQDREFITAKARDCIAFANTTRQPLGH